MPRRIGKYAKVAAVVVPLVGGFEGLRTVAYKDPVGIPTICYGEIEGVRLGDTATRAECDAMLGDRLAEFSAKIDRCLPANLPDEVHAAFLSAAYNIGARAFCNSSMKRRAWEGKVAEACDALLMWDKATLAGMKITLPGLTRRRAEERALCLSGLEIRS